MDMANPFLPTRNASAACAAVSHLIPDSVRPKQLICQRLFVELSTICYTEGYCSHLTVIPSSAEESLGPSARKTHRVFSEDGPAGPRITQCP
ncbi:MAG: hypothetical protein LBL86_05115, partial [Coriobacteriales bacterium]|nr:hypothetical protein [Coriobacteriales bacterium]